MFNKILIENHNFRMAGLTFNKKMQGQLAARKYPDL